VTILAGKGREDPTRVTGGDAISLKGDDFLIYRVPLAHNAGEMMERKGKKF